MVTTSLSMIVSQRPIKEFWCLLVMKEYDNLSQVDGNVKMALLVFSHLYIIQTKLGESVVIYLPICHTDNTEESYKELFEAIHDRAEQLAFSIDSLTVHLEFNCQ